MSKPMKRSAFFLSTAMVGLMAVYAPSSWSGENHDQHTQRSANGQKSSAGSNGDSGKQAEGMDHESMKGMDHGSMEGMDHSSMKGMDHSKMIDSHGSDKAEAGKDDQ